MFSETNLGPPGLPLRPLDPPRKFNAEAAKGTKVAWSPIGKLQEMHTRALSGIRGYFGPDSPQYDQAGGVRRSERKSAKRAAQPGKN